MDKDKLIKYLLKGMSTRGIAEAESISQTNVRYWLKKHKLKTTGGRGGGKWRRPIQFCEQCGSKLEGRNKERFCSQKCHGGYRSGQRAKRLDSLKDLGGVSVQARRSYLIAKLGRRCSLCGITEWKGQPVPVILDHIDGDPTNHLRNNFRIICPNCDAQLPTYTGRNRGNGRRDKGLSDRTKYLRRQSSGG